MEFAFTLRYRLPTLDHDYDVLSARLAADGCEDALIRISRAGYLVLDFLRPADSAASALARAIADVQRALPSAELIDIRSGIVLN